MCLRLDTIHRHATDGPVRPSHCDMVSKRRHISSNSFQLAWPEHYRCYKGIGETNSTAKTLSRSACYACWRATKWTYRKQAPRSSQTEVTHWSAAAVADADNSTVTASHSPIGYSVNRANCDVHNKFETIVQQHIASTTSRLKAVDCVWVSLYRVRMVNR